MDRWRHANVSPPSHGRHQAAQDGFFRAAGWAEPSARRAS